PRRRSAGRTANPDRPASQAHVRSRLVPDVAERELELEAIEEPRGHEDEEARDDASRGARVRPAAEGPRRHPGRRRREEPLPPEREGIGEELGKEVRRRGADEEVPTGGGAPTPAGRH